MNEKLRTYELEPGMVLRPFGTIIAIEEMGEAEDKYLAHFASGKSKTLRRNTKWWVDVPLPNEKDSDMVSHRRRNPNPHEYVEDRPFLPPMVPENDLPVAHYAENFQRYADAAQAAVDAARAVSASNPDGAVLYLHEATVQASLAQGHATMAAAMATKGAGVELRVAETE